MTQTRGNDRELMSKVGALRDQGKTWAEVTEIIGREFADTQGNPWKMTSLRSNFHRWSKAQGALLSDLSKTSDTRIEPPAEPEPIATSEVSDTSEVIPDQKTESDQTAEQALESPLTSDMSEPTDDTTETLPSDRLDTSDAAQPVMSELSVISDNASMPEAWQDQIRQIVQKELSAMQPEPRFNKEDIVQIIQKELTSMQATLQMVQTDQTPSLVPAPTPGERIKGDKGKPVNPGKRVKVAGTVDEVLERRVREWCRENRTTLSYALDAALWHFFGKPKLSFEVSDASETTDKGE
jgi:hypothetical protein